MISKEEKFNYLNRWKNCGASPYIWDESEDDMKHCIAVENAIRQDIEDAERLRSKDSYYSCPHCGKEIPCVYQVQSCAAGKWCFDLGKAEHSRWYLVHTKRGYRIGERVEEENSAWRDSVTLKPIMPLAFAEIHLPAPEPDSEFVKILEDECAKNGIPFTRSFFGPLDHEPDAKERP